MAKVSVIVPVFNGEKTLSRAVHSILKQSYSIYEIVIVLNNCNDDSYKIALTLSAEYPEILITHELLRGAGAARNRGLEIASGDLIAFCDCDDEWGEEKIQMQVEKMKLTGSSFCCSDYHVFRNGSLIRTQSCNHQINTINAIHKRIVLGCSTVLIGRETIGDYRFENLRMRQDFVFFCKVLQNIEAQGGTACCVNYPTTNYHILSSSLSSNKILASFYQLRAYRCLGFNWLNTIQLLIGYLAYALIDRWLSRGVR